MKVSECMTRDVCLAAPNQTIREAAQMMADEDTGILPVGENDRLVGMITDRDIAIRAVCAGKGPDTPVREIMSQDVKYCYEDETVEHVARNMGDIQVRRLPVVNRDKRLVGIISLGDLASGKPESKVVSQALSGVSRQGGQHTQTGARAH